MDNIVEEKPQLDTTFMKTLKELLKKEDRELTPTDLAFLKARWHYVGREDRNRLKGIVFAKVDEKGKNQPKADEKTEKTDPNTQAEQNDEPNNPFEDEE